MAAIWSDLQSSDLAVWISFSRWAYAVVATAHVLSVAVLIGTILTLDLRLIGVGRSVDPRQLAGLVVPIAGTSLFCAALTGGLLFIGRAAEYAVLELFQIKMVMIACAVALSLAAHYKYGYCLERATVGQRVRTGICSLLFWIAIGISGRMIAFVHG
jgi:hypothetical protein